MSYCDTRMGVEQWCSGMPRDAKMRIPDDIKNNVCFLCVKVRHNNVETFRYGGTAFFMVAPSEVIERGIYIYLATAKHNVERAKQHGDLYVRINTKDGRSRYIRITTDWFFPEDEGADVAVMPFTPPQDIYEYKVFDYGSYVTDEVIQKSSIGIGDELFIAGLFTQRHGTQKNIPIIRSGVLAAMPDEPFQAHDTGLMYDAYLAEVRSIGGLSGSPVFISIGQGAWALKATHISPYLFYSA